MGQLARLAVLTLILLCPVFTLCFLFPIGLGARLLVSLAIAFAMAGLVTRFTPRHS